MNKLTLVLTLTLLISVKSYANTSIDQQAGTCAMYLLVASKTINYSATADQALSLADKESRAVTYGKMYLEKLKKNKGNKLITDGLIHEGVSSCYDIGLPLK